MRNSRNNAAAAFAAFSIATLASSANAQTVLSSEDGEGETANYFLQTTANGPSLNVDYQLPGTFQHNNSWLNGHIASTNGPGAGSDPTGQHLLTRSTTGNMVLRTPLALASGGYTSVTIEFAVNVRYADPDAFLFLDYSADGDFTDSQNVLAIQPATANSGGVTPTNAPYEVGRWYAGQSVTLDPETYTFTDTANIRWRSGGWANSTQILLDDIVITGQLAGGTVPDIIDIAVDGSGNVVLTLDGSEAGLTAQQSDDLTASSFVDVASTSGTNTLTIDSSLVDPNADGADFYRVRN